MDRWEKGVQQRGSLMLTALTQMYSTFLLTWEISPHFKVLMNLKAVSWKQPAFFVAFLNASQLISPTVEMKTLLCWTVSLHTPRCDSPHAKNKQTCDLQKLPNHFLNSRSGHSFQSQSFPRLPFTTIFPWGMTVSHTTNQYTKLSWNSWIPINHFSAIRMCVLVCLTWAVTIPKAARGNIQSILIQIDVRADI